MKSTDTDSSVEKATVEVPDELRIGLVGRIVFFVFVSIFVVGFFGMIFVRYAIGGAMSAGSGGASPLLVLSPIAALIIIIISGVFIFKK